MQSTKLKQYPESTSFLSLSTAFPGVLAGPNPNISSIPPLSIFGFTSRCAINYLSQAVCQIVIIFHTVIMSENYTKGVDTFEYFQLDSYCMCCEP